MISIIKDGYKYQNVSLTFNSIDFHSLKWVTALMVLLFLVFFFKYNTFFITGTKYEK